MSRVSGDVLLGVGALTTLAIFVVLALLSSALSGERSRKLAAELYRECLQVQRLALEQREKYTSVPTCSIR